MYKLSQAKMVASHSCLSVTAKDVSPVSSCPIWFSLTNITAVPPGYRADNTSVYTHALFCLTGVFVQREEGVHCSSTCVCVCASVFVSSPIVQVCVNTWAGRCVCVCVSLSVWWSSTMGLNVWVCVCFCLTWGKQGTATARELRCNTLLMWQTQ